MKKLVAIAQLIFLAFSANADTELLLSSKDIAEGDLLNNAQVLNGFGCEGSNQSPHLEWSGAPEETKSFAITAYDPDAPTGSGWWHWIVYDLDASVNALEKDSGNEANHRMPAGAKHGRNDFGYFGYGGACPPAGEVHRYQFNLHALDIKKLPVGTDASAAMLGYFIHMHSIGTAQIEARYQQ